MKIYVDDVVRWDSMNAVKLRLPHGSVREDDRVNVDSNVGNGRIGGGGFFDSGEVECT
jgi:hypothetical protein